MEKVLLWLHDAAAWLVDLVEHLGYLGVFMMTFIESTFVPIPAEATMIPAGYLVFKGEMNFFIVLFVSVLGTVGGSYLNYWIAKRYGRALFLRYGALFMMTPQKLQKLENFVAKHGALSTFIGRLIPGIRHYIAFPAGLACMEEKKFLAYTALGGAIWMTILLLFGYLIGKNEEKVTHYLLLAKGGILVAVLLLIVVYVARHRREKKRAHLREASSETSAD